jgi:hypothetical protein
MGRFHRLPPCLRRVFVPRAYIPGGLPCSLSSLSALPRLTDGDGEGLFKLVFVGATPGVADARRDFSDDEILMMFADAEGRRTCSEEVHNQSLLSGNKSGGNLYRLKHILGVRQLEGKGCECRF